MKLAVYVSKKNHLKAVVRQIRHGFRVRLIDTKHQHIVCEDDFACLADADENARLAII